MSYCKMYPSVEIEGKQEDSKLFKELWSFVKDRSLAVKLYYNAINPSIKSSLENLLYNELGEPTLESLQKAMDFKKIIDSDKIISDYQKEIENKSTTDSKEAFSYLQRMDGELQLYGYTLYVYRDYNNSNSPVYKFNLSKIEEGINNVQQNIYNLDLFSRMEEILSANKVAIADLYDLDRRLNVSGTMDAQNAKKLANGFIELIRLSKETLIQDLPEEFSHFIIRALKDRELAKRLIKVCGNEQMQREVLESSYNDVIADCDFSADRIAEETAGRLLSQYLTGTLPIPNKPYKNLLKRFIAYIKGFFSKFSEADLEDAIKEADKIFKPLKEDIMSGKIDDLLNIDNVLSSPRLNHVRDSLRESSDIILDIIDAEKRRMKIYENIDYDPTEEERLSFKEYKANKIDLLNHLEDAINFNKFKQGITTFLEGAVAEAIELKESLKDLENSTASLNRKAYILRRASNYILAYQKILKDLKIQKVLREDEEDSIFDDTLSTLIDQVSSIIESIEILHDTYENQILTLTISPFVGEGIEKKFKHKGLKITVKDMLNEAPSDISWGDRFFLSLSSCGDTLSAIIGKLVNTAKNKADLITLNIIPELQKAQLELEKSGVYNTDWMFEVDENGKKTGNYIRRINDHIWREKIKLIRKQCYELNKDLPKQVLKQKLKEAFKEFHQNNSIKKNGIYVPNKSYYNPLFDKNSSNHLSDALIKYYDTILKIKEELEKNLPKRLRNLYRAVQQRKQFVERLLDSISLKGAASQILESVKATFMDAVDDQEMDVSNKSEYILDFEGNRVFRLPLYYVIRLANSDELSTDVTSTMIAYTAGVSEYTEMGKIINQLELMRSHIIKRNVVETLDDKQLVESYKYRGLRFVNKMVKKGSTSLIADKINDYFEGNIYKHFKKNTSHVGVGKMLLSSRKLADFVNKMTSFSALGFSVLTGISNEFTGLSMEVTEAFSGLFFNMKNYRKAFKTYGELLPDYAGLVGQRVKTNMMDLINQKFNITLDMDREFMESNMLKKGIINKIFISNFAFCLMGAGEHHLHMLTALSMFDNYEMIDDKGKTCSLLDALGKKTDEETALLIIKKGYRKADGTAFTENDFAELSNKIAKINQKMHGVYNNRDKMAAQRYMVGSLAMLFRKWIPEAVDKRWGKEYYDFELNNSVEGYYRTAYRFLGQACKDLKRASIMYNSLSDEEKYNCRRAAAEICLFVILALLCGLYGLSGDNDDDDYYPDERSKFIDWVFDITEYLSYRMFSETGVLANPVMTAVNSWNILKTPFASMSYINNVINLLEPWEWFDDIEGGRYRGHYNLTRSLSKVTGVDNIVRFLDTADSLRAIKGRLN